MKERFKLFKINPAVIGLLLIALVAFGSMHLDTIRVNGKRAAYEQFLKEVAKPFKNMKTAKDNDQEKADSPDLASLQEFFMTMDPVEQRVTAERLPLAYK